MKFGPKPPDHPSVGAPCPACAVPFRAGDFTTLVGLDRAATDPVTDAEAADPERAAGLELFQLLAATVDRVPPAVFRARAAELLRELAATDEGQVVSALVRWGCRQVALERDG